MTNEEIGRYINDPSNDIVTAAFHMLNSWCQSQANLTVAYEKMCEALKRVGMELKINEALQ